MNNKKKLTDQQKLFELHKQYRKEFNFENEVCNALDCIFVHNSAYFESLSTKLDVSIRRSYLKGIRNPPYVTYLLYMREINRVYYFNNVTALMSKNAIHGSYFCGPLFNFFSNWIDAQGYQKLSEYLFREYYSQAPHTSEFMRGFNNLFRQDLEAFKKMVITYLSNPALVKFQLCTSCYVNFHYD